MCGSNHHDNGPSAGPEANPLPDHLYAKLTDAHCHIHDDRKGIESLVRAWQTTCTTTSSSSDHSATTPAVRAGRLCLMGVQPSSLLGQPESSKDHAPSPKDHLLPMVKDEDGTWTHEQTHTQGDWETVETLARLAPDRVVPCFGLHPWFAHKYYMDATVPAVMAHEASADQDPATNATTDQLQGLSLVRGPGVRGEMANKTVKALQQQMMAQSSSSTSSTTTCPNDTNDSTRSGDPLDHYTAILGIPNSAPADYVASLAPKLPTPRPLGPALQDLWRRLRAHPTALLGEVGLDRIARVPDPSYQEQASSAQDASTSTTTTTGNKTTLAVTAIEHQLAVVQEQLKIAAELDRAVSFHCVQAYGHWLDFLIRETKKLAAFEQQQQQPLQSKRMTARQRRELQQAEWERHVASTLDESSSDDDDDDDEDGSSEEEEEDDDDEEKEAAASAGTTTTTTTTTTPTVNEPTRSEAAPASTSTIPHAPQPKTLPPRLCMHSYGGSVDMIKAFVKMAPRPKMYFSFSMAINGRLNAAKFRELILAVPDDRLLIESDYHSPDAMVDASLVDMAHRIAHIKGWSIQETVDKTARNWHEFVYGVSP